MVNMKNVVDLQHEFDAVRFEMDAYHEKMQFYLEAYEHSVYYSLKKNSPARERKGVNLLDLFADKLIHYVAPFPKINIPARPEFREQSSKLEKVLLANHELNKTDLMWSQLAFDGAVMSASVVVSDIDYRTRRVTYERIDPRRAYWTTSDAQGGAINVLWTAVPMRRSAIKKKYNVDVSGSMAQGLDYWKEYDQLHLVDSLTDDPYYLVITRRDEETLTKWCGDKFLMESHKHQLGCMPGDVVFPIRSATTDYRGDFFLRRLTDLQCEFNETWRQRCNIVRRMGNPAVWGRNINNNQMQDVKNGLSMDGGFIGLKENGELGLLTIPETTMIDTQLMELFARMKDKANFPDAAFGTVAGANTSADALGMYYQPTTRFIDMCQKVYKHLLTDMNKKTILMYRLLLSDGSELTLEGGYAPQRKYALGGQMRSVEAAYEDTFTAQDLITTRTVVTTDTVTPKDDINYKRLVYEMARDGVLSKTSALDEIGFLSPQDEIDLLEAETSNESLNPDGMAKLIGAQAQQSTADAALLNGSSQQTTTEV